MPCGYRLFLGRPNTHLLTPEREPSTDQRNSYTNAWLLNQWLLLGVIGLLTGAEMTDSHITKGPPQHRWQLMRRNLEHTAQPTGSATSCIVSFPGASVGLIILFQVGGLVSRIFAVAWLVEEWLSAVLIACFCEGTPTESGQFQVLPKAIELFVCCTKCSNLGRNCDTSHLT